MVLKYATYAACNAYIGYAACEFSTSLRNDGQQRIHVKRATTPTPAMTTVRNACGDMEGQTNTEL